MESPFLVRSFCIIQYHQCWQIRQHHRCVAPEKLRRGGNPVEVEVTRRNGCHGKLAVRYFKSHSILDEVENFEWRWLDVEPFLVQLRQLIAPTCHINVLDT